MRLNARRRIAAPSDLLFRDLAHGELHGICFARWLLFVDACLLTAEHITSARCSIVWQSTSMIEGRLMRRGI